MPVHRRRLYLMRHGAVDYFEPDGRPVPPDTVPLNARGRAQADAAGALFAAAGVRFDRVLVSGLARTVETAQRVLAAVPQDIAPRHEPRLQEIRPGRLADLPREGLAQAFLGAFSGGGQPMEDRRFLGGESIGELLDRALPAFDEALAEPGWDCALWVLHGGVNRALLTRALTGQRGFLGGFEQSPACINVLDVGDDGIVVRATNLAPTAWLQHDDRHTTMEHLLANYLRLPGAGLDAQAS
jgi:broad specificity phosphatase PhoE